MFFKINNNIYLYLNKYIFNKIKYKILFIKNNNI